MKTIDTKCFAPKIDCLCWDEYPIHVHKYISIIFTKKFKKSPFLPFTRMKLMILFPIRYFVVMSRGFFLVIFCVFLMSGKPLQILHVLISHLIYVNQKMCLWVILDLIFFTVHDSVIITVDTVFFVIVDCMLICQCKIFCLHCLINTKDTKRGVFLVLQLQLVMIYI